MKASGQNMTVNGVPCSNILRNGTGGSYRAEFDRSAATLETVERIDWSHPEIKTRKGFTCELPKGYGFTAEHIEYTSRGDRITVTLKMAEQYWGDTTSLESQVQTLQEEARTREQEIARLNRQLDEADEAAIQLYEQLAAKNQGGI